MEHTNLQQAKKVAVIGAGTMGIGIAQLAAMHGHQTYIFDVDMSKSQIAVEQLKTQLKKRVSIGKMTQELFDLTFLNLRIAQDIQQLADANLIIEAILEKKEIKQNLFKQLATICAETTVFASNTSSISITAIASEIPNPERVVGLHFFNPAPVMKLVEIIRGLKTSHVIAKDLFALMEAWNKVPVTAKSTPGFIANRVARPYYAEAFRALQENVTTPEQLDFIMRECGGFAMGPCELTDLIGQDINFSVTQSVYQEFFYEPRYRPSLIQKELVDAGCLGRKSHLGFYDYSQAERMPKYNLPAIYTKSTHKLKVIVKGEWLHAKAFIQRIMASSNCEICFNDSSFNEIVLGDVSLRLSLGESVDIDYANEKIVLMDWHTDWTKAKAIPVVASATCTENDISSINQFFAEINMIPIWTKDHAGLYVIRTISMLVNEACEAVLHDVASEQDIDSAMKYGVNYPYGPFDWAVKIGYNNILLILKNMYRIYGEERYRPSLYLSKKVALTQVQQSQKMQPLCVAG
ncbi:3-hydroxyacyl-CoA dehydrogenase [Acinetobacter sp. ANC 3832]|uniref:3-hydroxyacyl-CoA dehydrogenase n=1 Tax=Acinetobacter sp. ANC 3832 TaxID=1977874 RepID=UPI000A335C09|nr:3-hydroxyacyl-CoA dehydrogenase [Acinetobacter sp. ANC 3832]OTG92752.1 3-hydroxyacyl-CoA dehydrogenase [Acinetobacter sp. ANC 3832]